MGINIRGALGSVNLLKGLTPASTPLNPGKTLSDGIEQAEGDDKTEPDPGDDEETDVPADAKSPVKNITAEQALQQIKESEKLMQELTLPWQEKLDEVCLGI